MSQKKVDKYKQQKVNRAKIMKRERLMHRLEMTVIAVVVVALLGWFGFSVYSRVQQDKPAKEYVLDTNALDSYMNELVADDTAEDTDDETATADDTEEGIDDETATADEAVNETAAGE